GADQALVAAAATILLLQGRSEAVPELAAFADAEAPGPGPAALPPEALAALLVHAWQRLGRREADGGDAEVLAEARRLLRLCCVSRCDLGLQRVAPATSWIVPRPLGEDLLLQATRIGDDGIAFAALDL